MTSNSKQIINMKTYNNIFLICKFLLCFVILITSTSASGQIKGVYYYLDFPSFYTNYVDHDLSKLATINRHAIQANKVSEKHAYKLRLGSDTVPTHSWYFDQSGELLKYVVYSKSGIKEHADYTYNAKPQLTHSRHYNGNGKLEYTVEYAYSEDKLATVNIYDRKHKTIETFSYFYEQNRPVRVVHYLTQKRVRIEVFYSYDLIGCVSNILSVRYQHTRRKTKLTINNTQPSGFYSLDHLICFRHDTVQPQTCHLASRYYHNLDHQRTAKLTLNNKAFQHGTTRSFLDSTNIIWSYYQGYITKPNDSGYQVCWAAIIDDTCHQTIRNYHLNHHMQLIRAMGISDKILMECTYNNKELIKTIHRPGSRRDRTTYFRYRYWDKRSE